MHHLFVLQHGLWGNPRDMAFIEQQIIAGFIDRADTVEVLNVSANRDTNSYGGIDGCGLAVAEAVASRLQDRCRETVTHASFVGYSLGGLMLRYAVGVLHAKHVFAHVRPVLFATFASPHVGAIRTSLSSSPSNWSSSIFNALFNAATPLFVSITGSQIMLRDCVGLPNGYSSSLIHILADPGLPFWQALELFQHRILYANLHKDPLVNHRSGAIAEFHAGCLTPLQLKRLRNLFDNGKYPSLVQFPDHSHHYQMQENLISIEEDIAPESAHHTETIATRMKTGLWFGMFMGVAVCVLSARRVYWSAVSSVRIFYRKLFGGVGSRVPLLEGCDDLSQWLKIWIDLNGYNGSNDEQYISERTLDASDIALSNLNKLEWKKFHVLSHLTRPHATIVRRAEQFTGNEDVVEHFVDTFIK